MLRILIDILLSLLRITVGFFIEMDQERRGVDSDGNQEMDQDQHHQEDHPDQLERHESDDDDIEDNDSTSTVVIPAPGPPGGLQIQFLLADAEDSDDVDEEDEEWLELGSPPSDNGDDFEDARELDEEEMDKDNEGEEAEPEINVPGCKHYQRKCQVVCPLESCGKIYTCRLCHDENETTHKLSRHEIREVICIECKTRQPVAPVCSECNVVFGEYFCNICNLYMTPNPSKPPFHCEPCNICRIGPKDHFFHCENCDMCLPISVKGNHKCIQKSSRNDCAVCLEDIHSARNPAHLLPCGHLLHLKCYHQMLKNGLYTCPLCNESMTEMKNIWTYLDQQIASSPPLPEEYANKEVYILCRDCHNFSTILFHFVGLKCGHCGGYNTTLERGIDFHNLREAGAGANPHAAAPVVEPSIEFIPDREYNDFVEGHEERFRPGDRARARQAQNGAGESVAMLGQAPVEESIVTDMEAIAAEGTDNVVGSNAME